MNKIINYALSSAKCEVILKNVLLRKQKLKCWKDHSLDMVDLKPIVYTLRTLFSVLVFHLQIFPIIHERLFMTQLFVHKGGIYLFSEIIKLLIDFSENRDNCFLETKVLYESSHRHYSTLPRSLCVVSFEAAVMCSLEYYLIYIESYTER